MEFLLDLGLQLAVVVILLWGAGSAVVSLIDPQAYRRDILLVSPFLGLGVVSALCHYLGWLGFSVGQFAWPLIATAGLALLLVALRRRSAWDLRQHWRIVAICVATYAVAMLPLVRLGYLTTVGSTIDGISYAVRSEYLREAALVRPEVPAGKPFYGWVASQIDLMRAGDVYLLAVVGAVSGQRSYELLTTTAALFFALTPASVYLLSRRTFHVGRNAALLAAGLAGIHNLLLWAVYDNFLSQSIAVSLFPLLLSFEMEAMRTLHWRATIAFAGLFTALLSLYPAYAVPVGAVGLLCAGIEAWQRVRCGQERVARAVGRYALWAVAVCVLLVVWNGVAVWRSLGELDFVGRLLDPERAAAVGMGNILVFPPIFEMAGLVAHANAAYNLGAWELDAWVLWGLTAAMAACAVLGWRRLPPQGRSPAAIAVAATVGLALVQRFGIDPPHGYPYGYFKAVSLVVLSLLPLFAQGTCVALKMSHLRFCALALLLAVVLLNGINTLWTIGYVLQDWTAVTRDVIEVAEAARSLPVDDWILLDLQPGVRQHWIGYLWKDRLIHYRDTLFTYHVYDGVSAAPAYQYALIDRWTDDTRAEQGLLEDPWYDPQRYRVVWSNDVYELRQRTDMILGDLQAGPGQGCWRQGEKLRVVVDATNSLWEARLGATDVFSGQLLGDPRTVQVILVVPERGAELQIQNATTAFRPGVWVVDLALEDHSVLQIENTGTVPIWLYRIKGLGVETGDPAWSVEVERRADGAAVVTQSVGDGTLRYDVTLVRPVGDDLFTYRLAVHIVDPRTSRVFGVWDLDFGPGKRRQVGTLSIDLKTKAAEGSVQGVVVPLDIGPQEVDSGFFEAQVVWWRLSSPAYLSLSRCALLTRDATGEMQVETVAEIPLTILPTPR